MIKLLLNNNCYPDDFLKYDIEVGSSLTKKKFFESKLLSVLNKFNGKLNLSSVEYSDLREDYGLIQKKSGLIIKETISDNGHKSNLIIAYVFLSNENISSRNSFVSQIIFPELTEKMKLYLNSPSFDILNHPIYFINMIKDDITANSIIRDFSLLHALDVNIIELFNNENINLSNIPNEIEKFIDEYYFNLDLEPKFFELNLEENLIKLKFPEEELLNDDKDGFKGSSEKFYWTEILPISVLATKNNLKIDFEEFENFVVKYKKKLGDNNKKIIRCSTIIEFLKKLNLKKNYHEL